MTEARRKKYLAIGKKIAGMKNEAQNGAPVRYKRQGVMCGKMFKHRESARVIYGR